MSQNSSSYVSPSQDSITQRSLYEVSSTQVRLTQVGSDQNSLAQVRLAQVCSAQVSRFQIGTTQISITQVGATEVSTIQLRIEQSGVTEVDSGDSASSRLIPRLKTMLLKSLSPAAYRCNNSSAVITSISKTQRFPLGQNSSKGQPHLTTAP
jgi:hypothetical protein